MKKSVVTAVAILMGLLVAIVGCAVQNPNAYVLTGDFSEMYVGGEVVIFSGYKDDQPVVVASAELADGKFRVEGEVDQAQRVFVYVKNGVGPNGEKWAPIKGQQFILEPGDVHVTYTTRDHTSATGHYNDIVMGSWKNSETYNKAMDEFQAALKASSDKTLSEEELKAVSQAIGEGQMATINLENEGLKEVALNHNDPMASLLAIQMLRYGGGSWVLEKMYELAKVYPENEWLSESIASAEARKLKTDKASAIAVGTSILDFEGESLNGETLKLIDVRKKNKYVLVEFWASWCGPCREEIPHMKKAYEKFHGKGFEIFAFSLDDDRDAWAQASEEEQLSWVNTSDLVGWDSPVAELYGVAGVPANYLVEAATGKIVAKNLRGYALDEKLAELLEEKVQMAPAMMMSM
ncbi:TlpA disulfide reductase family protein [Porticoccaceae bacterium LTM1]|nr:TlpA disulfide reductase family protein [Porticoccaceae bacterium LTM1]